MSDKFLLLVFRNKKVNDFCAAEKVISDFSESGYPFDKISYIDFGNPQEICRAVEEGKNFFENTVALCPREMENALKPFVSKVYGGEWDEKSCIIAEKSMFLIDGNSLSTAEILEILDKRYNTNFKKAYIRTVGAPAAKVEEAIAGAKAVCADIEFRVTENFGDCRLEMVYGAEVPEEISEEAYRAALCVLTGYVYALEDIGLSQRFVELLKLRNKKVCVAESFTGGGVCKRLVDISGVSSVFFEGLNTYSNEAKRMRLGVREETLAKYGAVSKETAAEMAQGLFSSGNCDVAISTTGIAGPKSDNTNKPVGLFYIGIATEERVQVFEYNIKGTRQSITETAINLALFLAYKSIK